MNSKVLCWIAAITMVAAPLTAQRRGGGSRGGGHSYHSRGYSRTPRSYSSHPRAERPRSSPRASHPRASTARPRAHSAHPRATPRSSTEHSTRIHRSAAAKDNFMRQTGHPHGWPGHVVDHINPLACGGADAPSNMQWQTTAEGKAKDKVERRGCSH